jgi:uncharacterized protein (TIGR02246 family)
MKNKNFLKLILVGLTFLFLSVSCNTTTTEKAVTEPAVPAEPVIVKPDMAAVKAEIQAIETAWAAATNARDVNALMALYADDAISMANNSPSLVGKAAIQKDLEENMKKRPEGSTVSYETTEVFGDDQVVTEIGTSVTKDATGKVTSTGKYIAIFEKRDGKYICIREIYNDDVKEK